MKEDINPKRTRELLAYTLRNKNEEARFENEDSLRNTFGTKATIDELYLNGNMVKFNINLFTKNVSDIPKETSIIASYSNTVNEVDLHHIDLGVQLRILGN